MVETQVPTEEVRTAHRRFVAAVSCLSPDELTAATALPGWTRAHVIAHVADGGRAFATLTEAALRGEVVALDRRWGPPNGEPLSGTVRDLAAWAAGRESWMDQPSSWASGRRIQLPTAEHCLVTGDPPPGLPRCRTRTGTARTRR